MPNFKKFISHTLHSLADYIERGNCNAQQWEAMRQGIIENLELNRQGMTEEQYQEVSKRLDSFESVMGLILLKLDCIEKTELEDAPTALIANLNPKYNVR